MTTAQRNKLLVVATCLLLSFGSFNFGLIVNHHLNESSETPETAQVQEPARSPRDATDVVKLMEDCAHQAEVCQEMCRQVDDDCFFGPELMRAHRAHLEKLKKGKQP